MPTIKLNKKSVLEAIGKKLSQNELIDSINSLGINLESIKADAITLEINHNRPDLLSEQGVARALSSFLGIEPGLQDYKVKDSSQHVVIDNTLKDIRPYTVCAIVKDLKLDSSKIREIINLQEKLHSSICRNRRKAAIGIYPLDKIKMPILFTALPISKIKFKPLGVKKAMTASEILAKHPAGKEYGHLLSGFKCYPVFVDAVNNILSMPPIINSELTGKITKKTKEVFIECSGNDLNTLNECLNIIVTDLSDMGASIYSMYLTYYRLALGWPDSGQVKPYRTIITPDLKPGRIKLDKAYISKILGINLDRKKIKSLLSRMGIGFSGSHAIIPAYRTDVLHQIDLVEDIAIAFGYDKVKHDLPNISTIAEENALESFRNKLATMLAKFNLLEVNTYHLINKEESKNKAMIKDSLVELENSLSKEHDALRPSLIPSLLKVLCSNKHHSYPQDIFEIAKIFLKQKDDVKEQYNLCIALCNRHADFTRIKQVLDAISTELGLKFSIMESSFPAFIPGRSAIIKTKGKNIGIIGEIKPDVLANYELEMPVALMELNVENLLDILESI